MNNMRKVQRDKRAGYFLKGPIPFSWIQRNIPDPTSRFLLVCEAFMAMQKPPATSLELRAKVWDCAGIEGKDQRSRVLAKIDRCPGQYLVERKQGCVSRLLKLLPPKPSAPCPPLVDSEWEPDG
jgi:hypothetical protein